MPVRQSAIAIGCMSGTRRTKIAAVLMAAIDKNITKDTRELFMTRRQCDAYRIRSRA